MPQVLPSTTRFMQVGSVPMPGQTDAPLYGWRDFTRHPYQTPDWMARQKDQLGLQRMQIGNSLLGQMASGSGNGMFNYSKMPAFGVPAPRYVGTGGVYTQGQIDAQSNLQRAGLQQQAATGNQNFASSLASRGFSPTGSPLLDYYQQAGMMKANAGAAQNETELNFNAAKANRDATISAQGVNANLYGSYTDALSRLADIQMRGQLQGQSQRFDLLRSLLGNVA